MSQTVPDGTELTFSITYKNGREKILKVMSGTAVADRLLQMSLDPGKRNASADRVEGMGKMLQVLKESRLSNLGKTSCLMDDISLAKTFRREPFDFTWVWGEGFLSLYKTAENTDENTTLGNNLYFENVGIAHENQYRQCLHLQCTAGNMLIIDGNLVVEISRSPKLKIDL